jgi:hypothetical protein
MRREIAKAYLSFVIPGQAVGLSPESITTIGSMDSGLAPSGAPRNDKSGCLKCESEIVMPCSRAARAAQKKTGAVCNRAG